MYNNNNNKLETKYNDVVYASRSHARWAIFFDLLNWKFDYKPNNFRFKDGTKYTPDFYLIKHNTFVQVRNVEYLNETDVTSYMKIAKEFKKPVLLLNTEISSESTFQFKPRNIVELGTFQINNPSLIFDKKSVEKISPSEIISAIKESKKIKLSLRNQLMLSQIKTEKTYSQDYFNEPYTLYLDEYKKYAWDSNGVKIHIPYWSSTPEYDSEGREFIVLSRPNTLGKAFSIAKSARFKDDNFYYKKTFKNTYHPILGHLKSVNIDNFQEYMQEREEPNFID